MKATINNIIKALFKGLPLVFLLLISDNSNAQKVSIIPEPVKVTEGKGHFTLNSSTIITYSSENIDLENITSYLFSKIKTATGYNLDIRKGRETHHGQHIHYILTSDTSIHEEGYKLNVTTNKIVISASKPAGLFWGTQSLLQLFPREIESLQVMNDVHWAVPVVSIEDSPRFKWRGLMFDVTRHFFSVQEVKQFIDNMVKYKYNMLHLHLSDDQGWRIQIDSLPLLTQVSAWRPKREGKWGNTPAPDTSEPKTYGGFYTHNDIREIVKYAADRYVQVMPEIDVPGHSMAALAAYPELSCTPGNYQVNVGDKFIEWHGGGKFTALIDNTLCPANEKVYTFLDKVYTEIARLFPFEYIHMGGDETAKNFWMKSDSIKALMQKEGLNDMNEVQSYFVKRVQQIIQSKGKKMMGWDEILEGGLSPDVTVMSWRGYKGGIAAAKAGHKVVMTPNEHVYLDLMQGDPIIEPRVYSSVRLNQSYKFDPLPLGVDPNLILGGQGNLWTEQIPHMRAAEYMLWPRGLAVAESVWSPKEKKNWNRFITKVENEFQRMDMSKTKYSRSMYDPIFTVTKDKEDIVVKLETEISGLDIFYSFDETNPDEFYPKYSAQLLVPKDAATLKVITYRNGKPIGRQINMPVDELKKRIKK